MDQTVTTIEELFPHLEGVKTARELGAVVIALVPVKLKRQLALEARDRLGRDWTDGTLKHWLSPAYHTVKSKEDRQQKYRRWVEDNPERTRENRRRWRDLNPDRVQLYAQRWLKRKPEVALAKSRRWRALAANAERERCTQREYARARSARDPQFRLTRNVRSLVWAALRGRKKSAATFKLVGCTAEEYRVYLETLFEPSMTWENWGEMWEIDHVKPLASFNLADPEAQRRAFHYSNTVPLSKAENRTKGPLFNGVRHRHGFPR